MNAFSLTTGINLMRCWLLNEESAYYCDLRFWLNEFKKIKTGKFNHVCVCKYYKDIYSTYTCTIGHVSLHVYNKSGFSCFYRFQQNLLQRNETYYSIYNSKICSISVYFIKREYNIQFEFISYFYSLIFNISLSVLLRSYFIWCFENAYKKCAHTIKMTQGNKR